MNASVGSALLWSNVLNEAPEVNDLRMHHEALPVERGTKWAANLWIHMYNIRTLYDQRCPASFYFNIAPAKDLLPQFLETRASMGFPAEIPPSMLVYDDLQTPNRT